MNGNVLGILRELRLLANLYFAMLSVSNAASKELYVGWDLDSYLRTCLPMRGRREPGMLCGFAPTLNHLTLALVSAILLLLESGSVGRVWHEAQS